MVAAWPLWNDVSERKQHVTASSGLHCSHTWFCSSFVSLFSGFAVQTVELSDCEKTQALALRVLLSLSKFNQHRIHEMDCYHGYSMIHQVLIKSKCIVGYHMLKVSHTLSSLLSSTHILRWSAQWNIVFLTVNLIQLDTPVPLRARVGDPPVTWPSDCVCNWAVWWLHTEMDSGCLDETLNSCKVTQRLWLPLSLLVLDIRYFIAQNCTQWY